MEEKEDLPKAFYTNPKLRKLREDCLEAARNAKDIFEYTNALKPYRDWIEILESERRAGFAEGIEAAREELRKASLQ